MRDSQIDPLEVPWQEHLPTYDLERLKLVTRVTSEPDAPIASSTSPYETLENLIKEALLSGEVDVAATRLGDFSALLNEGEAHGIVQFDKGWSDRSCCRCCSPRSS